MGKHGNFGGKPFKRWRDWGDMRPKFLYHPNNRDFDFHTERALHNASPSVVALVSYSGENELSQCCGTIIEADEDNMVTVITSANLIRRPAQEKIAENALADTPKVVVYASDETPYEGNICAIDFHFNLLVIKFKSEKLLQVARLRAIDDRLSLSSSEEKSLELRPHSMELVEGDPVIVVGRYFTKPFDIMAAPGCVSDYRSEDDCKEVFLVTCKITACGDGAPLINLSGEVIGITFYDPYHRISLTPFLPINIAQKWWKQYRLNRESRHPYLGFEASNLYVASITFVERFLRRFPSISNGIIVEMVLPGSFADSAGLLQNDVIVKCDGKNVESFLQLYEVMWENVGGVVDLLVARVDSCTFLSLKMMVVEATTLDKLNR